jgi:hypothetical protein
MLVLQTAVPPHPSLLTARPDNPHYGGRFAQTEAVKIRRTVSSLYKKTPDTEIGIQDMVISKLTNVLSRHLTNYYKYL